MKDLLKSKKIQLLLLASALAGAGIYFGVDVGAFIDSVGHLADKLAGLADEAS